MFRNGLEPWHLLILVAVLVLVSGSKKLPEAARSFGKSMRILKNETRTTEEGGGTPRTASPASGPAAPRTPHSTPAPTADVSSTRLAAEGSHGALNDQPPGGTAARPALAGR
ncbi:twin-arginine translocase TatA/TatE family subunit [Streptomyces violascens]|uniref:twin-arginine translocase TatA/TatE family subunit n=1 Tax=Streptomyces violascens TaxID=67381 RepID=UPI0037ACA2C4